ncbi:MAG: hypothetical protein H7A37_03435 [Chlamydiales bacterium]|nr:hypothetical protein [Chlamydiia bacterium]MCP5507339.1 hypothetical protein [Chlamydiales bacterium]
MSGRLFGLITDMDGNEFYLPIHGIQAKDASGGGQKWLTIIDAENDGVKRSKSMLKYKEKHGTENIKF